MIADTAQNSIEAGAKNVAVTVTEDGKTFAVRIVDDGKGMDAATLAKAFDPFYTEPGKHARRRVGLGLPILKQTCEACDGAVSLTSEQGKGTVLEYHFAAGHVDLPPVGDLPDMVTMLFNYPGASEIVFTHRRNGAEYAISKSELADAAGGLDTAEGIGLAKEFLASQEESLSEEA